MDNHRSGEGQSKLLGRRKAAMHTVSFKRNRLLERDRSVVVKDGTTILESARLHGIPMGGLEGAEADSHCYIVDGMENLSEIDTIEDSILERAPFVTETSRVGYFSRVHGDVTVIVTEESLSRWLRENPEIAERRRAA